jgi:hypothetical protein
MADKYGRIKAIEEVRGFGLGNVAPLNGTNGSHLGFSGMVSSVFGGRTMDGYRVTTTKEPVLVLIDNQQSCCESWGYMASDDDLSSFVGANLRDVELADTRLGTWTLTDEQKKQEANDKEMGWSPYDEGGVQFVTFKTSRGDFQLAVYNGHNGYYGHGIIVAVGDKIVLDGTL